MFFRISEENGLDLTDIQRRQSLYPKSQNQKIYGFAKQRCNSYLAELLNPNKVPQKIGNENNLRASQPQPKNTLLKKTKKIAIIPLLRSKAVDETKTVKQNSKNRNLKIRSKTIATKKSAKQQQECFPLQDSFISSDNKDANDKTIEVLRELKQRQERRRKKIQKDKQHFLEQRNMSQYRSQTRNDIRMKQALKHVACSYSGLFIPINMFQKNDKDDGRILVKVLNPDENEKQNHLNATNRKLKNKSNFTGHFKQNKVRIASSYQQNYRTYKNLDMCAPGESQFLKIFQSPKFNSCTISRQPELASFHNSNYKQQQKSSNKEKINKIKTCPSQNKSRLKNKTCNNFNQNCINIINSNLFTQQLTNVQNKNGKLKWKTNFDTQSTAGYGRDKAKQN